MKIGRVWPYSVSGIVLVAIGYAVVLGGASLVRGTRGEVVVVESEEHAAKVEAEHSRPAASRGVVTDNGKKEMVLVFDPTPEQDRRHDVGSLLAFVGLLIAGTGVAVLTGSGIVAVRRLRSGCRSVE